MNRGRKKVLVILPSEIYGKSVAEALLRTFGTNYRIRTFVVTNQLVADYSEFSEEFLDEYRRRVQDALNSLEPGEDFYVLAGGNNFLGYVMIATLFERFEPGEVKVLVYGRDRRYGAFTLDGRSVEIPSDWGSDL